MSAPAIELIGVDKRFGEVIANDDVHLSIAKGSIHGIIGENGAGKSTLMSILYGFYQADRGEIRVNGEPTRIASSDDAISAGIGMVHQHFMLVDTLSVLENVILGAEGGWNLNTGLAAARVELQRLEAEYTLEVDVDSIVGDLPVGLQQRVEILKALYRGADILVLDEPTGVLTPGEADHLFRILGVLRDQGKTVVLITHKLREIMAVTDAVSVMRQGKMVATRQTKSTNQAELAELMVGRRVLLQIDKAAPSPGETVLSVSGLGLKDARGVTVLTDISFDIRAGEIVGIAGVSGNGQSELLECLSGIIAPAAGKVVYRGQPLDVGRGADPATLRDVAIAHVPEDRHRMGLVTAFSAWESAMLGYHNAETVCTGPFIKREAAISATSERMSQYDVRPQDPLLKSSKFSGGNQQKIVLAREIEQDPQLLLIGQPTRGVDIGAIEFIHRRLVTLRDAGKAILLVSVELDEIRALADRILVMFDGRIVGTCDPKTVSDQEIGLLMAGIMKTGSDQATSQEVGR